MIARKLKTNTILISAEDMRDNYESYTMLDISKDDALSFIFSADNLTRTNEGIVINYTSGDAVDKLYKAIANNHKSLNNNFIDVSQKYKLNANDIEGTSLLLRDANKHVIKICKRSTTNDNTCSINRLFIPNNYRDKFFKEVQYGQRFQETGKYELDSRDTELYTEWSNFMNDAYFGIVSELKQKGRL